MSCFPSFALLSTDRSHTALFYLATKGIYFPAPLDLPGKSLIYPPNMPPFWIKNKGPRVRTKELIRFNSSNAHVLLLWIFMACVAYIDAIVLFYIFGAKTFTNLKAKKKYKRNTAASRTNQNQEVQCECEIMITRLGKLKRSCLNKRKVSGHIERES